MRLGLVDVGADAVVAGGAIGSGLVLGWGLGVAVAIGGADFDVVGAGGGVPIEDPLAPTTLGEFLAEAGFLPFALLSIDGDDADFDTVDAADAAPGDAGDGLLAGGELLTATRHIDAGLGLDGGELRPASRDPVAVEGGERGEFDIAEPLGGGDVAVEAGDDEAGGEAVVGGEGFAVHADGNHGGASVQGDLGGKADGEAIDGATDDLGRAVLDAGAFEQGGEWDTEPDGVADEVIADLVGDAGEGDRLLDCGHLHQFVEIQFVGLVDPAFDAQGPVADIDARYDEGGVDSVELAVRGDQAGLALDGDAVGGGDGCDGFGGGQDDCLALRFHIDAGTEDAAAGEGGDGGAPDGGASEGEEAASIGEPSARHDGGGGVGRGGWLEGGCAEQAAEGPPADEGGDRGVEEGDAGGRDRVAGTGEGAGKAEGGERGEGDVLLTAGEGSEQGAQEQRDDDDGEQERLAGTSYITNSDMGPREVRQFCQDPLTDEAKPLLATATERLGLSARAFHRVLKVARTIADLDGSEEIGTVHLGEAIQYRRRAVE